MQAEIPKEEAELVKKADFLIGEISFYNYFYPDKRIIREKLERLKAILERLR